MVVSSRRERMGRFVATKGQVIGGWLTTAMMAVASVAMLVLM